MNKCSNWDDITWWSDDNYETRRKDDNADNAEHDENAQNDKNGDNDENVKEWTWKRWNS